MCFMDKEGWKRVNGDGLNSGRWRGRAPSMGFKSQPSFAASRLGFRDIVLERFGDDIRE